MSSNDAGCGDVAVVGDGSLIDHAIVALVERCGYAARVIDPADASVLRSRAILFRDEVTLARLVRRLATGEQPDRRMVLIGVGAKPSRRMNASGRNILWINGADATSELARVLRTVLGAPDRVTSPVHITHRELEVLRTYLLGATSKATAQAHFIGQSTVKTHYKRVTQRYAEAGRPVSNKAQLLRQMVADGWIDPDDVAGAA